MSLHARIEAIHRGDLGTLDDLRSDPAVEAILATGHRVADATRDEGDRVGQLLGVAGLAVTVEPVATTATRHEILVKVEEPAQAERAADVLAVDGFDRWDHRAGGAQRSFHHHGHQLSVARTDDHTTVVRLIWADPGVRSRAQRLLKPTAGDWDLVSLPGWAWRGYSLVRPARIAAERLGIRRRHAATLGPFLATPDSLLDPALDFAGAGADDLVIDLGCGDGRLLVAAATRGCQALGVDRSVELVEQARARADAAGVADRVRVEVGDARTTPVGEADVVFVFLPSEVLGDLLPSILAALRPGARVVAHEQTRLPPSCPRPDESTVLVGDNALTVAHRWTAGHRRGGTESNRTA